MNCSEQFPGTQSVQCAAALIVSDSRILLGLRSPHRASHPNVWDVFGGHVESAETIEEALVRELREELDITPTKFWFVAIFAEPDAQAHGKCLYYFYKVTSWSGPGPRLCGTEHTEIRWHSLDQALALDLPATQYRMLFRNYVV